jgi:hypothetical protein
LEDCSLWTATRASYPPTQPHNICAARTLGNSRDVPSQPRNDLQQTYRAISTFPLRDALGAVVMVADVTELEKTRIRLRTLRAVREQVGRTLDVVATRHGLVGNGALTAFNADVGRSGDESSGTGR